MEFGLRKSAKMDFSTLLYSISTFRFNCFNHNARILRIVNNDCLGCHCAVGGIKIFKKPVLEPALVGN